MSIFNIFFVMLNPSTPPSRFNFVSLYVEKEIYYTILLTTLNKKQEKVVML